MPQIEYDDGCKDDSNPGALILFCFAVALILGASFYTGTRLWRWMHDRHQQHAQNARYAPLPMASPHIDCLTKLKLHDLAPNIHPLLSE